MADGEAMGNAVSEEHRGDELGIEEMGGMEGTEGTEEGTEEGTGNYFSDRCAALERRFEASEELRVSLACTVERLAAMVAHLEARLNETHRRPDVVESGPFADDTDII